ncbi:MAG: UDP-N-acetylglucosamine 2-epimerase [Capsulimonadales bacterium]|nr:UDP-N-acetylglucosamine 2-epimerase [Capsulimonadales bacterium]
MARRYSFLRRRPAAPKGNARNKLLRTSGLLNRHLSDQFHELLDKMTEAVSPAGTESALPEQPHWYRRMRILSKRSLRRGVVLPKVFLLPKGVRRSPRLSENEHPDVLILSAHFGNGHVSAARALEEEFAARGYTICNVESLLLSFGPTGSFCKASYEAMVKHWPGLWGAMYRQLDRKGSFYEVVTKLETAMLSPLDKYLLGMRPKVIIATHPLPLAKIATMRDELKGTLIVSVVTDVHPHIVFSRGTPDLLCVPTDTTSRTLLYRDGIPREKIHVTGIPINRAFTVKESKEEARKKLRLSDERPILLVSSGGIGGGPIEEVLDALSELTVACEVIVICGRNQVAYQRLSARVAEYPVGRARFTVKGALNQDEMARHLRACDLFVAKAGGLTFSETTAIGRPLVVYAPLMIPGQEEDNASLLRERKAGLLIEDPDELRQQIEHLLRHPDELAAMSERSREIGRPFAAAEIVRLVQERGVFPENAPRPIRRPIAPDVRPIGRP